MQNRFMSIWFPYLKTDWLIRRDNTLKGIPFVTASPDHGRMVITAVNALASAQGITKGMVVADARVIIPALKVIDDQPGLHEKLINALAAWCIRFTPFVAIDLPDGLILDVSGCAHLWGGEANYFEQVKKRFADIGYYVRLAIADTIGAAWAITRYGRNAAIVETNQQATALLSLPPASLRIEPETTQRLHNLGLHKVEQFINMPQSVLRRRFGDRLLTRLDQALGNKEEIITPIQPIAVYTERLQSLEPIVTLTGIEIALQQLLKTLCNKLQKEQKGIRTANFKCYRVDGKVSAAEIGTSRATANVKHLFRLFEEKLSSIEPAFGIELFTLEAVKVEDSTSSQSMLWQQAKGLHSDEVAAFIDRITGKFGAQTIHRYVPAEHYWPEWSYRKAQTILEENTTQWKLDRPRPLQLLSSPAAIEVAAPVPDYPPMHFRYKGILHKIMKADGPERIEQEWWLQQGQHRDYYAVEDENGYRYWIFRLGHYTDESYQWFLHGYFA